MPQWALQTILKMERTNSHKALPERGIRKHAGRYISIVKGVTVLREPKIRMMKVLLRVWLFMNAIKLKFEALLRDERAIPAYFSLRF